MSPDLTKAKAVLEYGYSVLLWVVILGLLVVVSYHAGREAKAVDISLDCERQMSFIVNGERYRCHNLSVYS